MPNARRLRLARSKVQRSPSFARESLIFLFTYLRSAFHVSLTKLDDQVIGKSESEKAVDVAFS